MTEHNWKPGDVAMVAYDGEPERVMLRATVEKGNGPRDCWLDQHYRIFVDQGRIQSARPLAVVDYEDREQVERLTNALDQFITRGDDYADGVQAALREFAAPTPPKPDEPQGLGAVVEDASGLLWTRVESGQAVTRNPWYPANDADKQPDEYNHIKAVRVLSLGVVA